MTDFMVPSWFQPTVYYQNKLASLGGDWTQSALDAAFLGAGYTLDVGGMYRHFCDYGNGEGISPNALFDTWQYLRNKTANTFGVKTPTDVQIAEMAAAIAAAGMTLWDHYANHGWREGINPSDAFDANRYFVDKLTQLGSGWSWDTMIQAFFDSGLDPITHYYAYGMGEGLSPKPVSSSEPPTPTEPTPPVVNDGSGIAFDGINQNDKMIISGSVKTTTGSSITVDANGRLTLTGVKDGQNQNPDGVLSKTITLDAEAVMANGTGVLTIDITAGATAYNIIGSRWSRNVINAAGTVQQEIHGGSKNDTITVENGGSIMFIKGETGADTITVKNGGKVFEIYGGTDNDIITIESGGTVSSIDGDAGDDTIIIKSGATVIGTVQAVYGDDGNDTITIESGATVKGYNGAGGGDGNDIITVAGTVQAIYGGNGADIITVKSGGAVNGSAGIYGGNGADIITVEVGATVSSIAGDQGADIIKLNNQSAIISITSGDTGGYSPPQEEGIPFSLAGIDQIHNLGSGTTFKLFGGWANESQLLSVNTTFIDVEDDSIYWIQGTVDSINNIFTANSDGTDALLVYDAASWHLDPITARAVALVGVDPSHEFFATDGGVKII